MTINLVKSKAVTVAVEAMAMTNLQRPKIKRIRKKTRKKMRSQLNTSTKTPCETSTSLLTQSAIWSMTLLFKFGTVFRFGI